MIRGGPKKAEDSSLHLPRMLCLHGGGTNAQIFRAQCRALEAHLKSSFRFCYAEAPFPSDAGPDVLSVYQDYGPFKRWLPWLPEHPILDSTTGVEAIDRSLETAMKEDDRKGATGDWVALLGFSQGAKVSASLLLRQQARADKSGHGVGSNYRFAVLLAGRAPLVALDPPEPKSSSTLVDAAGTQYPAVPEDQTFGVSKQTLRLPTIHVHGLQDPGLHLHRQLLEQCCEKGSTRLVEWNGNHRLPIKTQDVSLVVEQILAVAKETGVLEK
ncbi:MAG: hypothetical protein M1818_003862 [Claussenomyces sp. TS43310]|nr:MAG: hypothetical protein M1818_003862 [Claussenomyces sp. TS43310]